VNVDALAAAAELAREAGLAGDGLDRILGGLRFRIVAIGWATVDLDRLADAIEPGGGGFQAVAADELLGAAARLSRAVAGKLPLVLLEPTTEGRLAAALARRAEGPAVVYLAPNDGQLGSSLERLAVAGIRTRPGSGPFGEAALVLGRAAARPQLILVAVPSGA
jgi:hypothetical protein